MIEILTASALATVQDMGRKGYYQYGLGTAGAMDPVALAIGNALLGNPLEDAGIEIPVTPFSLRFHADTYFALTGADCNADLDGFRLPPDWAMPARAGQVLTLGTITSGCRAYLCLPGGIDVPSILGSRSTQLREGFGGHEGRPLQKGDKLHAKGGSCTLPMTGIGAIIPSDCTPIRVIPAAEYEIFTSASREDFWKEEWKVSAHSNRAGYRLSGKALKFETNRELRSHGLVPGVIQVPSGGQPIIQLSDAATMGGYPKIGTVIEADRGRLGQVKPGDTVRFVEVNYSEAVAAEESLTTYIEAVATTAARQRRIYDRIGR